MTKEQLVDQIAKEAKISKRQAGRVLKAFFASVTDALQKGQRVSFSGFGTFAVSQRQARAGRHPRTGGRITIPAARVPKFRPGKGLKDAVKK
jgi:DNA-binding protein HU-beta